MLCRGKGKKWRGWGGSVAGEWETSPFSSEESQRVWKKVDCDFCKIYPSVVKESAVALRLSLPSCFVWGWSQFPVPYSMKSCANSLKSWRHFPRGSVSCSNFSRNFTIARANVYLVCTGILQPEAEQQEWRTHTSKCLVLETRHDILLAKAETPRGPWREIQ